MIAWNTSGGYMCINNEVVLSNEWKTKLFLHVITANANGPIEIYLKKNLTVKNISNIPIVIQ